VSNPRELLLRRKCQSGSGPTTVDDRRPIFRRALAEYPGADGTSGALQAVGSFKLNVPIQAHDLDHTWRVDFRPFAGIHHRKRAAHEVVRLREAFEIDDPPIGLNGFDSKDARRSRFARLHRLALASTHRDGLVGERRVWC
jgi:hypothetical protein